MNMDKQLSLISFLIIVLFVSVFVQLHIAGQSIAQQTAVSNPGSSGSSGQTPDDAVIGHLQTRDKILTIRCSTHGPLYTVKSKDGKLLAVDLSSKDLYAEFPDLKEIVESGLAGEDASLRGINFLIRKAPMRDNKTKIS